MKKLVFVLGIALLTSIFSACLKEEAPEMCVSLAHFTFKQTYLSHFNSGHITSTYRGKETMSWDEFLSLININH